MSLVSAISREYSYFKFFLRLVGRSRKFDKKKYTTVADILEEQVEKTPGNIAIEFEDKKYSYRDMDNEANKIANWAIGKGYKTGDVISLLMENKPEYIFTWFGLAKVGITIACLNNNIKSKSLAHCIKKSGSKSLIISSDLMENLGSAQEHIDGELMYILQVKMFKDTSPWMDLQMKTERFDQIVQSGKLYQTVNLYFIFIQVEQPACPKLQILVTKNS